MEPEARNSAVGRHWNTHTHTFPAGLQCDLVQMAEVVQQEYLLIGMGKVAQAARRWARAGRPQFDPGCRRGGDFSSLLHVQTGPEVHSASYKMITGGFPRR